eukprot:maker-scaffold275_size226830-snap-gene-0.24 protein:Tk00619 transcript:maker-scaffold275_size226830-snap-gene-0.24-mRNA-1 annotation:"activator of basal transcription 1"
MVRSRRGTPSSPPAHRPTVAPKRRMARKKAGPALAPPPKAGLAGSKPRARVVSPFCMDDSSQEDDDIEDLDEGYNVTRTTEFFSAYGQIGRVFLQPDQAEKSKEKVALRFTEGWIEFMSKRVAKDVAENVNCTPVGGKKKAQTHDIIWNIKYLPRFKWSHLTERLNYEKATHHQKMRTEISAAKKEADFFKRKVDMSNKRKYSKKAPAKAEEDQPAAASHSRYEFRLKQTDDEIRRQKQEKSDESRRGQSPPAKKRRQRGSSGRVADGHQPVTRGSSSNGSSPDAIEDRKKFLASVFGM